MKNFTLTEREAEAEIAALKKAIDKYRMTYYRDGTSPITDRQYDALFTDLEILERSFPEFATDDSPTCAIGYAVRRGSDVVKHVRPMLSLNNIYDEDALVKFIESHGRDLNYHASMKIDGIAAQLIYINGRLTSAATRGDGEVGEDITAYASIVNEIPVDVNFNAKTVIVPGELAVTLKLFDEITAARRHLGMKPYASQRHAVIGLINSKMSSRSLIRDLSFIPHGAYGIPNVTTHHESLETLSSLGFHIPDHIVFSGKDTAPLKIYHSGAEKLYDAGGELPIDGVVVRVDDVARAEDSGNTVRAPRYAVAYKFKEAIHVGVISSIAYSVGRTGAITPTASLRDPVVIHGSSVTNVSLYSAQFVINDGYAPGASIAIEMAGGMIPSPAGVLIPSTIHTKPTLPDRCPSCNQSVKMIGLHLKCTNVKCAGQLFSKLLYACSKTALNFKGLAQSSLVELNESYGVVSLADLIRSIDDHRLDRIVSDRTAAATWRRLKEIRKGVISGDYEEIRRCLISLSIPGLTPGVATSLLKALKVFRLNGNVMSALQDESWLSRLPRISSHAAANLRLEVLSRKDELTEIITLLSTPMKNIDDDIAY